MVLVLQIIAIGGTLLAERYTYVPYIGIAFLIGMLLDNFPVTGNRSLLWSIPTVLLMIFGIITFQRTKVWKDSDTLWTNALKHFPDAAMARINRANYVISILSKPENIERKDELLQRALEDCNEALKAKLNQASTRAYENRQYIYLRLNKDSSALSDANSLIRLEPENRMGYYAKGAVYQRLNMPDSTIKYLNKCLEINPNTDFALNNRGKVLFGNFKKYNEALADFDKAISLNPQGEYFLSRSYCYYQLGYYDKAKADAISASQKGATIPDNYKSLLQLK
jgi:tetratricopeptide (TPR) repeat protein